MDFNDSPEEAAFRKEVYHWLKANAELRKGEDNSAFGLFSENESDEVIAASKAWQLKKCEAGWAGITWPKAYGGRANLDGAWYRRAKKTLVA